jgi:hypothetical protein
MAHPAEPASPPRRRPDGTAGLVPFPLDRPSHRLDVQTQSPCISFFANPSTRCIWRASAHCVTLITLLALLALLFRGLRNGRTTPLRYPAGRATSTVRQGGPFSRCRQHATPTPGLEARVTDDPGVVAGLMRGAVGVRAARTRRGVLLHRRSIAGRCGTAQVRVGRDRRVLGSSSRSFGFTTCARAANTQHAIRLTILATALARSSARLERSTHAP